MDMATTTHKEPAMNTTTITIKGRDYTINLDQCAESDIFRAYEITGKRGASGALLVYKPETFGICARVMWISELERLSDYVMTTAIMDQTDLIPSEEVAA
jgi:hypothetical protein